MLFSSKAIVLTVVTINFHRSENVMWFTLLSICIYPMLVLQFTVTFFFKAAIQDAHLNDLIWKKLPWNVCQSMNVAAMITKGTIIKKGRSSLQRKTVTNGRIFLDLIDAVVDAFYWFYKQWFNEMMYAKIIQSFCLAVL